MVTFVQLGKLHVKISYSYLKYMFIFQVLFPFV